MLRKFSLLKNSSRALDVLCITNHKRIHKALMLSLLFQCNIFGALIHKLKIVQCERRQTVNLFLFMLCHCRVILIMCLIADIEYLSLI